MNKIEFACRASGTVRDALFFTVGGWSEYTYRFNWYVGSVVKLSGLR